MARRFGVPATRGCVEPHSRGHIHETWFATAKGDETGIVLQRLNDAVFPDCDRMMDNVVRVIGHLQDAEPPEPTLSVLRSEEGPVLARERGGGGRPWRAFRRVVGASTREVVDEAEPAYQIGRGLGRFLAAVQDLAPPPVEPIAGFKDFARRRAAFETMVVEDPFGRVSTCPDEIDAVRRHYGLIDDLVAAMAAGQLPERIVHNDAKADNVLLDDRTGEMVCILDLDTVAVGTVLFDIGDLLRTATVTLAEDTTDLAALSVRDDLLEAALGGYLAEAGDLLTGGERALIPIAGPLMAYENALRFLLDHLAGDTYFQIDRSRQNLDRARSQLRVLDALASASGRVAELVSGP